MFGRRWAVAGNLRQAQADLLEVNHRDRVLCADLHACAKWVGRGCRLPAKDFSGDFQGPDEPEPGALLFEVDLIPCMDQGGVGDHGKVSPEVQNFTLGWGKSTRNRNVRGFSGKLTTKTSPVRKNGDGEFLAMLLLAVRDKCWRLAYLPANVISVKNRRWKVLSILAFYSFLLT